MRSTCRTRRCPRWRWSAGTSYAPRSWPPASWPKSRGIGPWSSMTASIQAGDSPTTRDTPLRRIAPRSGDSAQARFTGRLGRRSASPSWPGCRARPSRREGCPRPAQGARLPGGRQQAVVEPPRAARALVRYEQLLHQGLQLRLVEHLVLDDPTDEPCGDQRHSRRQVDEPWMPADGDGDRLDHLAVIDDIGSSRIDRHVVRLFRGPGRDLRDILSRNRLDAVVAATWDAEDGKPPQQPRYVVDQDVPLAENQRRPDDRPRQA